MEFAGSWIQTMKFFVTYEIINDNSTVKMTLNAGELQIDASTVFGTESEISASKTEIYKDLLAVTAVSPMVEMTLKFEKAPMITFQEFLTKNLKFSQLAEEIGAVSDVSFEVQILCEYFLTLFSLKDNQHD